MLSRLCNRYPRVMDYFRINDVNLWRMETSFYMNKIERGKGDRKARNEEDFRFGCEDDEGFDEMI